MSKLSIITICYNEPDVQKTCESIVNQTWQDFEWIVVDGGSNKETLDIFEKYKNRMSVFISEKDNGRYNAFNKGLEYIKGEYVHFLNAGDYYHDEKVLENVFASKTYQSDILHGDLLFRDNSDFSKDRIKKTNYPKITPKMFINEIVYHPATFIKADLFKGEKAFRFNENYKIVSDLEMWIVFALNGVSFDYIPYVISIFNTEGLSENQKYIKLHNEERNGMLAKYFTSKEILIEKKKFFLKTYTLPQNIFSIRNSQEKAYKVISVLGFKIWIKNKRGK